MTVAMAAHLVFTDLAKERDGVPVCKVWEVLEGTSVPIRVVKGIKQLYESRNRRIEIGKVLGTEFPATKGLWQEYCLSPTVFNIYLDKVLEKWRRKCNPMAVPITEEVFLYTLHFADNQVVIAQDKEDTKYLCKKLKRSIKIGI
jgi:hypothetical protein